MWKILLWTVLYEIRTTNAGMQKVLPSFGSPKHRVYSAHVHMRLRCLTLEISTVNKWMLIQGPWMRAQVHLVLGSIESVAFFCLFWVLFTLHFWTVVFKMLLPRVRLFWNHHVLSRIQTPGNVALVLRSITSYKQGQNDPMKPKIREYFYFIDHNGMVTTWRCVQKGPKIINVFSYF